MGDMRGEWGVQADVDPVLFRGGAGSGGGDADRAGGGVRRPGESGRLPPASTGGDTYLIDVMIGDRNNWVWSIIGFLWPKTRQTPHRKVVSAAI